MLITAYNDNVIHIDNEIDASLWRMLIKERVVDFILNHAKLLHNTSEAAKPGSRGLFKSI